MKKNFTPGKILFSKTERMYDKRSKDIRSNGQKVERQKVERHKVEWTKVGPESCYGRFVFSDVLSLLSIRTPLI